MNNPADLFECTAQNVADAVANNSQEFLSDSEVNLLRFHPQFKERVQEKMQELYENCATGAAEIHPRRCAKNDAKPVSNATLPPGLAPEHFALLLDRIQDRRSAGWSDGRILRWASTSNIPRESIKQALKALGDMDRAAPLPVGQVEYSKRSGSEFLLVSFERSVGGGEVFQEKEYNEVRWYPHKTSPEEDFAARFLLRAGWSSCRIVVDDVIRVLPSQADILAAQADLEQLLALVGDHAALAAALVKDKGLNAEGTDLQQDVARQFCARRRAGMKLCREAARFVPASLRNRANSQVRHQATRPTLVQESEGLLASCLVPRSREAQQAQELIDAVRPKLSPLGRFALAFCLNEVHLEDYAREAECCKATAKRHFVKGMSELAQLIRQELARWAE